MVQGDAETQIDLFLLYVRGPTLLLGRKKDEKQRPFPRRKITHLSRLKAPASVF